ncbi:MAG: peptidase domain-containing ABC transporter [Gammaproteobacteria bacterium]
MFSKYNNKFDAPIHWRRADVLFATLVLNITSLALPLVILQVYDRILPNDAVDTFALMIGALLFAALIEVFLRIARSTILSWKGAQYEHATVMELLEHTLHADLVKFESKTVGRYLNKIDAVKQIRDFYSGQTILMIVDLPFVFLFLALIWVFSRELVLVPLSVMAIFAIVSYVMGKKLKETLNEKSDASERKQNFLIEVLQGMHIVKSMAMEASMMRRLERLQGNSAHAIYDLSNINSVIQSVGATFSQVVMMCFVGIGSIYVVNGDLTVGALAAGTMLSGRVMQPALKAMGLWTQLQGISIAKEKIQELRDIPLEAINDQTDKIQIEGKIEFDNVHFRHDQSEEELIKGISLKIEQGESVGITGSNGSGKSTLIELLMGFMSPSEGVIKIDDKDICEHDRSSMRAQIGYMPQHGVIFEGTILDNLTMFREGTAVDRALEIANKIGLTEVVMRLPEGLDTQVSGANYDSLPVGVRQQIILVRSLVGCMSFGEPKIILFDDADSSLDTQHDKMLVELLMELREKYTMIIVSHRPSILRLCNRNYMLEDGDLIRLPWLSRQEDDESESAEQLISA